MPRHRPLPFRGPVARNNLPTVKDVIFSVWKWVIAVLAGAAFVLEMNINFESAAFVFGFVSAAFLVALLTVIQRAVMRAMAAGASRWSWSVLRWVLALWGIGTVNFFVAGLLHIDALGMIARQGFWTALIVILVVVSPTTRNSER